MKLLTFWAQEAPKFMSHNLSETARPLTIRLCGSLYLAAPDTAMRGRLTGFKVPPCSPIKLRSP